MPERKQFVLMNKDTEVLLFESETDEYGDTYLESIAEPLSQLPIGFADIHSFIVQRQAPKHREHIKRIMRQAGCDHLEGFLQVTKALSLNDTFWVKSYESNLSWNEVSLYRNNFDETIARLAFEGGEYTSRFSATSPEFSTDGLYAKCWVRKNENIFLLKTGSEQYGMEPYSEYFASQISSKICVDAVQYSLDYYHSRLVSKCPIFTNETEGFAAALKVLDTNKVKETAYLLEYFQKVGVEDAFRRMVVLDALIINNDRHIGNYGFVIDNATQKILRMAPVFDHNRSLAYKVKELDTKSLKYYLQDEVPRIGVDFNQIAHKFLTPEIKSDLLNLRYFSFELSDRFPFSKERLKLLEKLVHNQIENILGNRSLYHYSH
ncbi:MAG: HipA protein [Lachnospiraceae bacterium]|nr:HipA protein [Lachnospiraceae bacterium]